MFSMMGCAWGQTEEMVSYLFTYFTGNAPEEEQICYALSDDETKPVKWPFPKDAVIPAGGYYIIFCSGKSRRQLIPLKSGRGSANGAGSRRHSHRM